MWVAISAGAALALAALVWAVALSLQTDPSDARALRTRYSILSVTAGTEPLVLGARWQKAALRINPGLAR